MTDRDGRERRLSLARSVSRPASEIVLFIGGSGAFDEDGISGDVDLGYADIIDDLVLAGRLVVTEARSQSLASVGPSLGGSFEDAVGGAEAASRWIRETFTDEDLVLIGHSLGGLVALRLAAEVNPAAVILLATPGRPLEGVLIDQTRTIGHLLGLSEGTMRRQKELLEAFAAAARSPEKKWDPTEFPEPLLSYAPLAGSYQRLFEFAPESVVETLSCPLLIIQGTRDLQVSVDDAERLFRAARAAGVDATLYVASGVDHLLKPSKQPGTLRDYGDRRRRVAKVIRRRIVEWLTVDRGMAADQAQDGRDASSS